MTTTISSKRQITLPAALCREMGLEPGMKLEFSRIGPDVLIHSPEMSRRDFDQLLEAAQFPEPLPMPTLDYIRRIRDGGDLDEL